MRNGLTTFDLLVFLFYLLGVSGYGYYIYKRKQSKELDSKDYFLAEGSLTWWAIGASMIASNISAEQFIGASGAGFTQGLAVAVPARAVAGMPSAPCPSCSAPTWR